MALQGIRSVLAVPLSVDERTIFGIIYADSPTYEATFTEEHLNILTTLASVASIRVGKRFAHGRTAGTRTDGTRARARNRDPAAVFSLPHRPSSLVMSFKGFPFRVMRSAATITTLSRFTTARCSLRWAMFPGKGTAAALLMSSVHAAIHAQVSAKTELNQAISSVNHYLAENTPANRFVTLFAAELEPETGILYLYKRRPQSASGRESRRFDRPIVGGRVAARLDVFRRIRDRPNYPRFGRFAGRLL